MKIIRFERNHALVWGIVKERMVHVLAGDIYEKIVETGNVIPCEEVKPVCPVSPSKIIAVGLNYFALAKSAKMQIPEEPILFLKPPSSVIGSNDSIVCPDKCERVNYEGEVGVVIGKKAKNVGEDDAIKYVFGYTAVNDVSAMEFLERDRQQTTRVKGFDTFCAVGPAIVTNVDFGSFSVETRLNGKTVQSSSVIDMIFTVPRLISFISSIMTLMPGDLIATGTPAGVGPLKRGDLVEVEIGEIGILKNSVV